MKKFFLFFTGTAAMFTIVTLVSWDNQAVARPNGISGVSGSVTSCSNCHQVANTVSNGLNAVVTSDIPASGYVPGTVYNLALTIKSQKSKVGFNLRAQNNAAAVAGAFSNVSSNAQITTGATFGGSAGELTHTSANTISGGAKTITFKWTAPAAGSGPVTYFGAIATGVAQDQMDTLNKITLVFNEGTVTSVDDAILDATNLQVFPTVSKESFTINYTLSATSQVNVSLYDQKGTLLKEIFTGSQNAGSQTQHITAEGLKEGAYMLQTSINGISKAHKIFVQK